MAQAGYEVSHVGMHLCCAGTLPSCMPLNTCCSKHLLLLSVQVLLVSQFTLYARLKKPRPDFSKACPPNTVSVSCHPADGTISDVMPDRSDTSHHLTFAPPFSLLLGPALCPWLLFSNQTFFRPLVSSGTGHLLFICATSAAGARAEPRA